MDSYQTTKDELLKINHEMASLLQAARSLEGIPLESLADWQKTCRALPSQISEELMRVAIVGPIKSGKSTFVNSLFEGDFVKRGAGVVTSIVTRLRKGDRSAARLLFKSWKEINAEMEQALVLFPSLDWRSRNGGFDLRERREREELTAALTQLGPEQLISKDARNLNNVLLSSYLKGFPRVHELLSTESAVLEFAEDRFSEHWFFVGDENLAVYLRDIQLDIRGGGIEGDIEIADCQGSDSSNPLHLAMIQDYLLMTNLLVYVISSRTGLRRADIRFLSMIKKMGILDNIFFVVNTDFSEHESLEDLQRISNQIREELSMFRPDPETFSFSALFNLFNSQAERLSGRDRLRWQQWSSENEMVAFSDSESERFNAAFAKAIVRKRYALLLKNHIQRLGVIAKGLRNRIDLHREMLARDSDSVQYVVQRLKSQQRRLATIESSIQDTMAGVQPKLRQELNANVNRFLDASSGEIVRQIAGFIERYQPSQQTYQQQLDRQRFPQALHRIYQEFKQTIDNFITEEINPEIIRFIRSQEKAVNRRFQTVVDPFNAVLEDAMDDHRRLMLELGIETEEAEAAALTVPRLEALVRSAGLSRPSLSNNTRYSTKIKTDALLRLGAYSLLRNVKRLVKKEIRDKRETAVKALEAGTDRMKSETLESIREHLVDYQENLKFRYLFRLAETAAEALSENMLERFRAYSTNVGSLVSMIGNHQIDREKAVAVLSELHRNLQGLRPRIARLKETVEPPEDPARQSEAGDSA
jgi:GTPase SAR1 family protein